VCGICGRSFARLEHLKRHERSHTKEKPFECPECTRCFARRDLLLRHQQKLHMTTTPAARPRHGRRESTSSTVTGSSNRVRKNSTVNPGGSGTMRPRANTISHVGDANALGFLAAVNTSTGRTKRPTPGHSQHPSLNGLPGVNGHDFRGMPTGLSRTRQPGLPKIETQGLHLDFGSSLRTAPAFHGFPHDYGFDAMFSPGTINPAQLHFSDSPNPLGFEPPISPFHHQFNLMSSPTIENDGAFDWIDGFDTSMTFGESNEQAIAESSPSAMSAGSPGGPTETVQDVFGMHAHTQSSAPWQPSTLSQAPMLADYSMDMNGLPDSMKLDSLSPKQMDISIDEKHFQMNPSLGLQSPTIGTDHSTATGLHFPFLSNADTPTTAASVGSSNRHSSVTSVCTDAITDQTRAALLASLSQPSSFLHRKYSSPSGNSPHPSELSTKSRNFGNISLPSTYDLQRYVSAYIQYFHPHLPFLHISTLSFNSSTYTNSLRTQDGHMGYSSGITGGGGCLILAMAAIGALYEYDNAASKELFDLAKKMIQVYLEERRKADISTAINGRSHSGDNSAQNTPLWLVQAMLLNVIYGHNCGDKTSADIASTHCAALVSLARAAELPKPSHYDSPDQNFNENGWPSRNPDESIWYNWKMAEEKKRTLYAVFILSSMLVSGYNHSPALTNSEVLLDLPCDEELWAADSYEAWMALGGLSAANAKALPFAEALGWLLNASQRQPHQSYNPRLYNPLNAQFNVEIQHPEFSVSTYGCFILINALHNYIWEIRQRHLGRQWTTQETESMHAHMEPALAAWQAIWTSNPQHSLERPNPYGMGPLSADCIPLLDLAYVRLFVNLGRSKEAFWHRDFEGMSHEIARGAEIIQHADHSSAAGFSGISNSDPLASSPSHMINHSISPGSPTGQTTKRERHMRKAAFRAAHSLAMSDKLGVSFADFSSRELPIQSALCAFDCAQVLAEWVSTVQERVGRYLGILGKDQIDFENVPGIMLVDSEDINLFAKIDEFLSNMELKMAMDTSNTTTNDRSSLSSRGYGSKILMVTAYLLERSAVWPGMLLDS
jgi:hypothetical protein